MDIIWGYFFRDLTCFSVTGIMVRIRGIIPIQPDFRLINLVGG